MVVEKREQWWCSSSQFIWSCMKQPMQPSSFGSSYGRTNVYGKNMYRVIQTTVDRRGRKRIRRREEENKKEGGEEESDWKCGFKSRDFFLSFSLSVPQFSLIPSPFPGNTFSVAINPFLCWLLRQFVAMKSSSKTYFCQRMNHDCVVHSSLSLYFSLSTFSLFLLAFGSLEGSRYTTFTVIECVSCHVHSVHVLPPSPSFSLCLPFSTGLSLSSS